MLAQNEKDALNVIHAMAGGETFPIAFKNIGVPTAALKGLALKGFITLYEQVAGTQLIMVKDVKKFLANNSRAELSAICYVVLDIIDSSDPIKESIEALGAELIDVVGESYHIGRGKAVIVVSPLGATLHLEPGVMKVHEHTISLISLELKKVTKDATFLIGINWKKVIAQA